MATNIPPVPLVVRGRVGHVRPSGALVGGGGVVAGAVVWGDDVPVWLVADVADVVAAVGLVELWQPAMARATSASIAMPARRIGRMTTTSPVERDRHEVGDPI